MSQYKLYSGESFGFSGTPIIITTSYTSQKGILKGECFLAISGRRELLFSQRSHFETASSSESGVNIDEEFMFKEVLQQATSQLQHHFYEKRIAKGHLGEFRTSDEGGRKKGISPIIDVSGPVDAVWRPEKRSGHEKGAKLFFR